MRISAFLSFLVLNTSASAWTTPTTTTTTLTPRKNQHCCGRRSLHEERLQLQTKVNDNDDTQTTQTQRDNHNHHRNGNGNGNGASTARRSILTGFAAMSLSMATATATATTFYPIKAADAAFFNSKYSLSVVTNTNSTAAASIRQPLKESPLFANGLETESCLLKLLPVKKPVFRKIEKDILSVSSLKNSLLGT